MPTTRAEKPQDLLPIIEDAINRADLDAFLAAHDGAATVVVPPGGRPAHGHDEIRAAMAPVLAMRPRLETAVVRTLLADGSRSVTAGGGSPSPGPGAGRRCAGWARWSPAGPRPAAG